MTAEITMTKRGALAKGELGLFPDSSLASDDLMHVPSNKELLVKARAPRSINQHRFAWALAQKVAENCHWLPDKRAAMDYMLIKSRHVDFIVSPNGELTILPKSIAFASLSQDAFSRVLNRMIYIVCSEIIPGLNEKNLRSELEAMCTGNKKAA